ncbi:hypothetical protein MKL09_14170 [Methylobacterium sp. J-048]|uniref:hypothetical protein n=1 Tax=Methylobacterium sp. J-048 TaxID=2836635 RepID=UPI001FB93384|nr:hypothetical protein [Methylobacterium sp. J-048]MCJ2057697.1 hypothetical protein [Methylobacterium sp. J-048]
MNAGVLHRFAASAPHYPVVIPIPARAGARFDRVPLPSPVAPGQRMSVRHRLLGATKRIEAMADGSGSSVDRSRRTLQNLAKTLGCSPETFFGEPPPDHLADAEELLQLWLSITDSSERRRVLAFAQTVKAASDARLGDA